MGGGRTNGEERSTEDVGETLTLGAGGQTDGQEGGRGWCLNPVEGEEKEEAGDEERDEEAQEAATREGEGRAR